MATERPTYIELPSLENSRSTSAASERWDLSAPRIQHYDGDIPPSLSPLDAFAAHSRRLAKELEETRKAGQRRMSRLPPQHVTQSLTEHQLNRPSIFRQLSNEGDAVPPMPDQLRSNSGNNPKISEPRTRPQSSYPRHSAVLKPEDGEDEQQFLTPRDDFSQSKDYFGIPPSESPPPLNEARSSTSLLKIRPDDVHYSPSNPDLTFTLAPPNAAFARKSHHESSDDDYASSNAGSTFSQTRKLSSSSGMSLPHSPASPLFRNHQRSPSNNSNSSLATSTTKKSGSHMNFSRPMSSSSLTMLHQFDSLNIGVPERKGTQTSQGSVSSALPGLPTPTNSFDESRSEASDGFAVEGQCYTHRTYTLPRGRQSNRTSQLFLPISGPDFVWHEPMFPGTPPLEERPNYGLPITDPEAAPRPSNITEESNFSFDFQIQSSKAFVDEEKRPSSSDAVPSSSKLMPTALAVRPSTSHAGPSQSKPGIPPPPIPEASSEDIDRSSRSDSTVRPSTARSVSNYQAWTADEHVSKAIDLHQHGDLKESTYHLRIAAKQDHPTGMLLYALACRHGWGMRTNLAEGVMWLRKAVDSAMLEVADDETPNPNSDRPQPDLSQKKTHRAQFALAIYELGQCHLNGWGMEMDKGLALRCFEIAGNWGDTDALSEAGFCYAQGIGCKKDMKRAAKFYRMAEQKGVSMVGNSWIYKDKYNDDDEGSRRKSRSMRKTSGEENRNKSRTRSIFLRKKA